MTARYDLLLRGGRIIDPAMGRDEIGDVAVSGGLIRHVGPALLPDDAPDDAIEVIDVSGQLVIPGMIDTHGHIYQHVTGKFGLPADLVGIRSGVTTIVDQGGPSALTLGGFRHFIAAPAQSRVLCFLSAYLVGGLEGHLFPDLYGPQQIDVAYSAKTARDNEDLVRGIKAHAEIGGASRWGLDVIKLGKQIAREAGLPLYIHLGQLWPTKDGSSIDADRLVEELAPLMDAGDVLAHPFTRHPGGFISAETGELHPVVKVALARGVTVDVGHGSHFSFAVARKAMAAGVRPTTLGADLHGYNTRLPGDDAQDRSANPFYGVAPFSLTNAMSKLLVLGMTLPEVVATVTSNAAALLGLSHEIGSLAIGRTADISVLSLKSGRFQLRDNSGDSVISERVLHPCFALKAGQRFDADSPLIAPIEDAA